MILHYYFRNYPYNSSRIKKMILSIIIFTRFSLEWTEAGAANVLLGRVGGGTRIQRAHTSVRLDLHMRAVMDRVYPSHHRLPSLPPHVCAHDCLATLPADRDG